MSMLNQNSVTSDGALATGSRRVWGFWVTGDGTNAGRVVFYDNASEASGTVLMDLRCGKEDTRSVILYCPIECQAGIYADVTTVGRAGAFYE